MFGLQPSDQEPDINAEHFGDADDQLDGRGACPPATHDGGDAAFGESTTGLDVAEAQVVHQISKAETPPFRAGRSLAPGWLASSIEHVMVCG
jgi:hypothetical protein